MSKRASALVTALSMVVVLAQAGGGDPHAPSNESAPTQSRDAVSGGNAMAKGRSGNSGPGAKAMGGSNALSGSGQKKKQP